MERDGYKKEVWNLGKRPRIRSWALGEATMPSSAEARMGVRVALRGLWSG